MNDNTQVTTRKETMTQSYWRASLAWKNIDNWAEGWTTGEFIAECRRLCGDQGRLGNLADQMLDDVVYDRERNNIGEAKVVSLR